MHTFDFVSVQESDGITGAPHNAWKDAAVRSQSPKTTAVLNECCGIMMEEFSADQIVRCSCYFVGSPAQILLHRAKVTTNRLEIASAVPTVVSLFFVKS